jgi:hypothetical protein
MPLNQCARAALAVAFVLACADSSGAQVLTQRRPWYVATALSQYVTADVVDAATTGAALAHGAHEVNPLLRPLSGRPTLLGLGNGAIAGAATFVIWKQARHHPKSAALVASVLAAVELSAAMHNLHVIQRAP